MGGYKSAGYYEYDLIRLKLFDDYTGAFHTTLIFSSWFGLKENTLKPHM